MAQNRMFRLFLVLFLVFGVSVMAYAEKPRLIVLTDIGGDPDDQQSMVRLMVHSNEFDIEALIASASGTPGELGEYVTKAYLIEEIVNAYGDVRSNLVLHDADFPTEQYLLDRIKSGNPFRGADAIGSGHDTEGSEFIISVIDKSDPRPVNISIWGGQTDLAQALWKVKNTRSATAYNSFISKIRVHDIGDQDGMYSIIKSTHPDLWYVLDKAPAGVDKRESVFRGMYLGGDESLTSLDWLNANVRQNHGPLGALYPDSTWTAPNPYGALKEGDTPSWFYFLPMGFNDPSHPDYGSWGGRFQPDSGTWFIDDTDTVDGSTLARATVYRWRPAYQAQFQARMDWCVKSYADANHSPVLSIAGGTAVTAESGQTVSLNASGSTDPDGDSLSFKWWQYKEPGTYTGSVSISGSTNASAFFTAPSVTSSKTIHLICEVKDNGSPNLTSYVRVIVTVNPSDGGDDYDDPVPDNFDDNNLRGDWMMNGNGTLTEQNGRVEFDSSNSSSTWEGAALTQNALVDLSTPLVYDLDLIIPDTSANQFTAMYVTPQLSFGTDGTPASHVSLYIRGSEMKVVSSGGLDQSIGTVSAGTIHVQLTVSSSDLTVNVDDVQKFSGAHLHAGLGNGAYIGFRAANKSDSAGGIAGFDNFLEAGVDPADPTVITSPSPGSVFNPGQSVTAAGTGDNLSWEIDLVSDGQPYFDSGTGSSITFTVPADADETQVINIKLIGDGGTVSREYAIEVPDEGLVSDPVISSGKAYEWITLQADAEMYIDRTYVCTSVDTELDGAVCLRTANDDKLFSTASTLVSFTVNEDAYVYVIYTNMNTAIESDWCNEGNGWEVSSYSVETDLAGDEAVREVRRQHVSAGTLVELPGNGGTSATCSMYNVAVVPGDPVVIPFEIVIAQPLEYQPGTLQVGNLPYVDRSYTFTDVPPALAGKTTIRTANNDKYSTSSAQLIFSINKPADLYVAYDVRADSLPAWMSDWTDTGMTLSNTDGAACPMNIFTKSYGSGSVTLGGNHAGGDTGANSNYIVIVSEAGAAASAGIGAASAVETWSNPGDSDGDGLSDAYELFKGYDPENVDTRADGTADESRLDADSYKTLYEAYLEWNGGASENTEVSGCNFSGRASGDSSMLVLLIAGLLGFAFKRGNVKNQ